MKQFILGMTLGLMVASGIALAQQDIVPQWMQQHGYLGQSGESLRFQQQQDFQTYQSLRALQDDSFPCD